MNSTYSTGVRDRGTGEVTSRCASRFDIEKPRHISLLQSRWAITNDDHDDHPIDKNRPNQALVTTNSTKRYKNEPCDE